MARKKLGGSILKSIIVFALVFIVCRVIPTLVEEKPNTPAVNDNLLVAEFLDVDQADCELIYLPDGKTLLIDAGNRGDGDKIVNYLKDKSIKKIDYLIATHPHADHIGGMSEVIDNFEIGKLFAPRVPNNQAPTSKTYEDFLTSVQKKGLKISAAKSGATLFEGEDYKAECFAPNSGEYEELNNYSVTVKLTYGMHSFLFTGDAESLSEEEMLKAGYNLDSDVLKVGHHGSSSSSSKKFLKAVSPKYAVISCGTDNSYNHPHKETVNALNKLSGLEKTFRTDVDKTIIFTADGKTEDGIKITTNNPTVVE